MENAHVQCHGNGTSKPLLRRFRRRVEKWARSRAIDLEVADFDLEVEKFGGDRFVRCALKVARGARGGGSLFWSVSGGRDLNQALTRCLADLDAALLKRLPFGAAA